MNEIRWQIKASSQRHRKKSVRKFIHPKSLTKYHLSYAVRLPFVVCSQNEYSPRRRIFNGKRSKRARLDTMLFFCHTASSLSSSRAPPLQTINTSQSFDHLNWNKYPHRPQETITRSLIEPSEQGKAIRRVVKTIRNVVETWLHTTTSLSPTFSRSALNLWVFRWFPFDEAAAAGFDGASLARIRSPSDSESMLDKK